MASQRRAGIIQLKVDGAIQEAKGSFSYNLGKPKRESIVGADGVHGFKETPQVAFIEGEITDNSSLDLEKLVTLDGVTATLEISNGKVIVLRDAWYAGEGTVQTDEANIGFRLESKNGEEIK